MRESMPPQPSFDPVRRCYLDALARRAAQVDGPARALLMTRLAQASGAYERELEAARDVAAAALAEAQKRFPAAAAALQRLFAEARFEAMHQQCRALAAQAESRPLASLLQHIDGGLAGAPAADKGPQPDNSNPVAHLPELRAVRAARNTWTRLRVDRQIARSLASLPDNPGPLNSHRLVLRCLQRLQGLSPAYVAHLLSQLDTLVWLEQAAPVAPREGRGRR